MMRELLFINNYLFLSFLALNFTQKIPPATIDKIIPIVAKVNHKGTA